MINKSELKEKRIGLKRAKQRRKIVSLIIKGTIAITLLSLVIIANEGEDINISYSIPEGAVSGGEYTEDGKIYERYQLGDKFFVLSKDNGAIIPMK